MQQQAVHKIPGNKDIFERLIDHANNNNDRKEKFAQDEIEKEKQQLVRPVCMLVHLIHRFFVVVYASDF